MKKLLVAAVAASLCLAVPAYAQAPQNAKLSIVGGVQMKAGKFIKDDQRFSPSSLVVRSGGRVTLRNKAKTEDPHSISVVKKSDLPKTPQQAFECAVCGSFFQAHQVNEETGEVGQPVVNVGRPGFDQPGDSLFVAPGATVRFDVSADRGQTLYYMCAVHGWMQGKLKVK